MLHNTEIKKKQNQNGDMCVWYNGTDKKLDINNVAFIKHVNRQGDHSALTANPTEQHSNIFD